MVFAFTKNFEIFVFPYATVLQPNTQTNTYMIMFKITNTHTFMALSLLAKLLMMERDSWKRELPARATSEMS